MINKIFSSISEALYAEFGEGYEIHKESVEQGLQEPCFLITCVNPTSTLFLNKRYFRQNQFCIQYFPSTTQVNVECFEVMERLLDCLELIEIEEKQTRGTSMSGEVTDDVLNFFVNFDMFVYKVEDEEDTMDELGVTTNV